MDYIWRHGEADIKIPYPVGSKLKMDNWRQNSGDSKIRYEEARDLVGALQGGGSENMEKSPRQRSSVEKYGSE